MGYDILNGHIVIKTLGGTGSVERVEPMANGGDVPEG